MSSGCADTAGNCRLVGPYAGIKGQDSVRLQACMVHKQRDSLSVGCNVSVLWIRLVVIQQQEVTSSGSHWTRTCVGP